MKRSFVLFLALFAFLSLLLTTTHAQGPDLSDVDETFLVVITLTAATSEELGACVNAKLNVTTDDAAAFSLLQTPTADSPIGCVTWDAMGMDAYPIGNFTITPTGAYMEMKQRWMRQKGYLVQNNATDAPDCNKQYIVDTYAHLLATRDLADPKCTGVTLVAKVETTRSVVGGKCPSCQGGVGASCTANADCLSDSCITVPGADTLCFFNDKVAPKDPSNGAMQPHNLVLMAALVVMGVITMAF